MIGVGSTVGRYEVVARLRSGGMGTLFRGRRRGAAGFACDVAIKVVHPHLAEDGAFVQMFVEEALLSARIRHPNVVHVEDLGEVDGTPFLAMEYVRGGSLAQLLSALHARGRRLSPALAVYVAVQVAEGLHAAHETRDEHGVALGVVHRDVSPHNVLLATSGHVKLIDFGIAKARGRSQRTLTGALRGKPAYMSPEQAYREAVDRRTDVYALGLVLWEMLTGRRLLDAQDELELLEQARAPHVVPPSAHNREIGAALDAVVLDALAFDPAQRPATALELRRRLADAAPEALVLGGADLAALLEAVPLEDAAPRARDEATASEGTEGATAPALATEPPHAATPAAAGDAVARLTVPDLGGDAPSAREAPRRARPAGTARGSRAYLAVIAALLAGAAAGAGLAMRASFSNRASYAAASAFAPALAPPPAAPPPPAPATPLPPAPAPSTPSAPAPAPAAPLPATTPPAPAAPALASHAAHHTRPHRTTAAPTVHARGERRPPSGRTMINRLPYLEDMGR